MIQSSAITEVPKISQIQKIKHNQQKVEVSFIKNKETNTNLIGKLSIKIHPQALNGYSINNISTINGNTFKVKIPFKIALSNNQHQKITIIESKDSLKDHHQKNEQIQLKSGRNQQFETTKDESIMINISLPKHKFDLNHYIRQQQRNRYLQKISFENFLKILKQELNGPIFQILLSQKIIKLILQEYTKNYISYQHNQQVLQMIAEYISFSINYANQNQHFYTSLKIQTFASEMGQKWLKLKEQIFNLNKRNLKVLGYIKNKPQSENILNHSFLYLSFDFSKEETNKVANTVKYLCKYNTFAYCFLFNYLLKCCYKLEVQQGLSVKQIQSRLSRTMNRLIRQHPLIYPFYGNHKLLEWHKNYTAQPKEFPKHILSLKSILNHKKIKTLQKFIYSRSLEAKGQFSHLNKLIRNICLKHGQDYKIDLKIKGLKNRQSFERIKQKIISQMQIFRQLKKDIKLSINPNKSIFQYTEQQQIEYRNQINRMFYDYDGEIQFKIEDLLRARCLFNNISALNHCCAQIIQQIQRAGKGKKLLMVQNRLNTTYCDILLLIRLGNTITEVLLALKYMRINNQFHQKMINLLNSNGKSILTSLRQATQIQTSLFLQEMETILFYHTNCKKSNDYNEEITFKEASEIFQLFSKAIPFHEKYQYVCENSFNKQLFKHQLKLINSILNHQTTKYMMSNGQINQRYKNNADFYFAMKQYQNAQGQYQKYISYLQVNHRQLLNSIYSNLNLSLSFDIIEEPKKYNKKQQTILHKYAQILNKLAIINISKKQFNKSNENLNLGLQIIKYINKNSLDDLMKEMQKNMIKIKIDQQQYQEALNLCQKLQAYQASRYGNKGQQIVQTINKKAKILYLMGNYEQSINLYKSCLEKLQDNLGKDNTLLIQILNQIGNIYLIQGYLQQALNSYLKCLQISQRQTDIQQNQNYAITLSNIALIYELDEQYTNALQFYQKSYGICRRINNKQSIFYNSSYGLAKCNYELKEYKKAVKYFNNGIDYLKINKYEIYVQSIKIIIECFEKLGDKESAEYYLDKLEKQKLKNSRKNL